MDRMLRDLGSLQARTGLRPDLIFFTGDAAYGNVQDEPAGKISEQFDLFGSFLETLLATFSPPLSKDQIFIVPGNHDVDRSQIYPEAEGLDRQPLSEVENLFRTRGRRLEFYMCRLAPYRDFLREFGLTHLLQDDDRLIYSTVLDLAGARIGIGGFNSAWTTGGRRRDSQGDRGRVWMAGSWQLSEIGAHLRSADLRIALIHHPGTWLRTEEDPPFSRNLRNEFSFVLHGHEHDSWIESYDSGAVVVSASAGFQQGERGYNLVQVDPFTMTGSVWLRAWDAKGGGWIPSLIAEKTDERGVWLLSGPKKSPQESQVSAETHWSAVVNRLLPLRESLRDQAVCDFRFFSSALDEIAEKVHEFIRWIDGYFQTMDPAVQPKALEIAQRFQDLPVEIEKRERLTELILSKDSPNQNARLFQIILLEYAERFTTPLGNLIHRLEEASAGSIAVPDRVAGFIKALQQLTEASGVARFQGLLSLLRTFRGRLLRSLGSDSEGQNLMGRLSRATLLDAFWGSFDLVLTEERDSKEVIAALLGADTIHSRKMLAVLQIVHGVRRGFDAIQKLKDSLERLEESSAKRERDQRIALRALTLHQAQPELRKTAVRQLDDDSAWRLLSMSRYPRSSANEIAAWILDRQAPLDRHRILFDLQHEDFMRSITRRDAGEIIEIQRFLLLIKSSGIMREWRYYSRYRELLGTFVESMGSKHAIDTEVLETHASLESFDSERSKGLAGDDTQSRDRILTGIRRFGFPQTTAGTGLFLFCC